jgi:alpha,alpha-trehalose-phosphate synthase [UDP-forming]
MKFQRRLVIASNRLPVTAGVVSGRVDLVPSDGGLVRAMTSLLRDSGGCWVGWPGSASGDCVAASLDAWSSAENYSLHPVLLTEAEQNGYYKGFSNEIIWPLFHGLSTRCSFSFDYWNHYRSVNARFAGLIESVSSSNDLVWVHDYHLMLVAAILNQENRERDLAYFHHIPFPPPDVFEILPWRTQILRALLQFNVVGFQTVRDQRNFVDCVRRCLPDARIRRVGEKYLVGDGEHRTSAGVYPISIDYRAFAGEAANPAVLDCLGSIKRSLAGARLILGVDRLDYTKGILERLSAYRILLSRYPELRERVTLIQIVVPSREEIPEYRQLRLKIENIVSNVNGEFGKPGWVPVQYFYRSVCRTDLVAYYRAADVAMVTPLRDGMNLVAKEFCASRCDARGALVLSEFAGAADELRQGAFIVNPHDVEELADVLHRALSLSEAEQALRMRAMRREIEAHNVYSWASLFAADCLSTTEFVGAGVAATAAACD